MTDRLREAALTLSRAAVLTAIFVLAWRLEWKFKRPDLDVAETPHHYLGQSIRAAEVLALIALAAFALAGPSILARMRRGLLPGVAVAALGLALLAVASTLWARHPGLAVVQGAHLLIWAAFALLVAGVQVAPQHMTAAFVLGLIVQASICVAQVITQNHVGLTVLGERPTLPGDPFSALTVGDSVAVRAYGLSPHPNVLAGHLAIGVILCWGLAAGRRPIGRRLVAVIWVVLFASLLLTFSRSGLLAAVLGTAAAVLWLGWSRSHGRQIRRLGFKLGVVAAVMIVIFAYGFSRYLPNRIPTMNALLGSDQRFVLVSIALKLIVDHPLAGVGAGNFSVASRTATSSQTMYDAVHNVPLLIEAELGLAGLAAMGAFATFLAMVGYRRWRVRSARLWHGTVAGGLVGLVTISLFDHYPWTHTQGGLMAAWLVGWWLTDDDAATSVGQESSARFLG